METIFLSCEPTNGRPREVGTIVCGEDGKNGFFLGYDQEKRVAIDFVDAQKLIRAIDGKYEMKVEVIKKRKFLEVAKEKILKKATQILSPQLTP